MASKILLSRINRRYFFAQWCHRVLRPIYNSRRHVTRKTTTRRPSIPICIISRDWILHQFQHLRREMRNHRHRPLQCVIRPVLSRSSMDLDTRNFHLGQYQQPQKHRKHFVHLQVEDLIVRNRGPITPTILRRRLWLIRDRIWNGKIPHISNR